MFDGIVTIGVDAFKYSDIGSFEFPETVTSIGASSLYSYHGRTHTIIVNENNQYYKSVDNVLYTKDGTELILYASQKPDTVFVIPDGVTTISTGAFMEDKSLVTLVVPTSLTSIGYESFYGCNNITNIYYSGTEEQWDEITIASGNSPIKKDKVTFNYVPEE